MIRKSVQRFSETIMLKQYPLGARPEDDAETTTRRPAEQPDGAKSCSI